MNGNGLTATLRHRTIYLAILVIFTLGALFGGLFVLGRQACQRLAAEQRRTVALFAVLADTSRADGAQQSSAALEAFANSARSAPPNC
jgi:hypothetical protein